jgi:diamine N-acetyltransferase
MAVRREECDYRKPATGSWSGSMGIELREITRHSVIDIVKLDAGDDRRQVAPNAVSIAQAHFEPAAWFRAVVQGERPVGFVMLYDPTLTATPESPHFFLWRLMIDKAHQGRGYGHAAVERLIEHVRTRPGASELRVSHVPEAQSLARFYQSLGFRYTGEQDEGELVMARPL